MKLKKCFFYFIYYIGESLECYVCTNQDQNHEKCLNTIKTCEPEEDMCLSEISWGCKRLNKYSIPIILFDYILIYYLSSTILG